MYVYACLCMCVCMFVFHVSKWYMCIYAVCVMYNVCLVCKFVLNLYM